MMSPKNNKIKEYEEIFNILFKEPTQNFRGDTYTMKELKINKDKIYEPKGESSSDTHTNHNKIVKFKYQLKNGNNKKQEKENINFNSNQNLINTTQNEVKEKFKYYIYTDINSFIHLSDPNFGTNDKDLMSLIELMNEPTTKENGYSKIIEEETRQVYKKHREGYDIILIKCYAKIPYSKDVIFEAISNLEIRKKWDSVFSELRVVNHNGENGSEILYMIIKSPVFFISDRDFIQQRKVWKNFPTEHSHILHFISVETPECPINKKCVRAETIISGYYMQDDPDQPGHSILGILSQTDIKGNIPIYLVNKFAPKSAKNWIKSLYKGCKMVAGY